MASIADLNDDLLAHCLSFSGRRGLATSSQVCRKWNDVAGSPISWEAVLSAEDDWPSLHFAESNLAQGPERAPPTTTRECTEAEPGEDSTHLQTDTRLPWPRIMRQRHAAPRTVVIDAGCGYCKFGWSTDPAPCGRIATFLEFGSIETPLLPRIQTLFKTIFSELGADPRQHPVIVTEPLQYLREVEGDKVTGAARVDLREAVYSVLFNRLQVPAVLSTNQAVLAAFQERQLSAIVVNVGFKATTVVPVVNGKVLPGGFGIESMSVAATRVTGCMHHLMEYSGIPCHNMFTIRALKENLCYVSQDSKEFTAAAAVGTSYKTATYEVPDEQGGSYTLGPQRFMAPEVLFNPMLFGLPYKGIQEAVRSSILQCEKLLRKLRARDGELQMPAQQGADVAGSTTVPAAVRAVRQDEGEVYLEQVLPAGGARSATARGATRGVGKERGGGSATSSIEGEGEEDMQLENFADVRSKDLDEAMKRVVVTGGTAAIPGLADRLLLELRKGLPQNLGQEIKMHPNGNGYDHPWLGGKMLAQTSSFASSWCLSREQYQRPGSERSHGSQGTEGISDRALAVRMRLRE